MPRGIYGAAAELLARQFGGTFRDAPRETISVGTTAVQLVGIDPERVHLSIVNLSGASVYVGPFADVSSSKGIRLNSNGGLVGMNVYQDAILPILDWWAVADAAASNVFILGVRREALVRAE